jgi:predicted membrane protein
MGILFSALFWGILLILFGIWVILSAVFHINFPMGKILFALFFFYLGIVVITGGVKSKKTSTQAVFSESNMKFDGNNREMNIVFGRGVLDLTDASKFKTGTMEFNTIFGAGAIILGKDQPVKIRVDSAFSGAKFPDGNTVSFGSYSYTTPAFKEGKDALIIKANVVFGGLEVTQK